MLEVNNEVSAEAVSQSVMTVTDFHLGGGFQENIQNEGSRSWHEEKSRSSAWNGLHFLPCICKHV